MAMSNAERQRRHYQRRKQAMRQPGDDTQAALKRPFAVFYGEDADVSDFEIPLHLAGIDPPTFDNDAGAVFPAILDGLEVPDARNSVERAELIVDCLLGAAAGLAGILNRYKLAEIARAEKAGDVDAATAERLRAQLKRNARWTLPQWKAKGD